MFSLQTKFRLGKSLVLKRNPAYVQFYITARCNLTCEQCNIIYANSDLPEIDLNGIKKIAFNLSKLGVSIVLLTGGEPFLRKDLPEIIAAFKSNGIHVRIQTNGLASESAIKRCVEHGANDISISLDSLQPSRQDKINGGFESSWDSAIKAISLFGKHLPKKSFASLGCVLSKSNISDVLDVIRFGTQIGWHTSLVPVHVTNLAQPRGFRTTDQALRFDSSSVGSAVEVLRNARKMRDEGYLLYDSDQYLDDIGRFISGERVMWRDKHSGVCDSPNLYFAILPNGEFAPCCDYRIEDAVNCSSDDFPQVYRSMNFQKQVIGIVRDCEGCMYGSYPEVTISMRFWEVALRRAILFGLSRNQSKGTLSKDSPEELTLLARRIANSSFGNVIVSDAKKY